MIINSESLGPKITNYSDNRMTKLGKLLRNYKLDELPQMINVLKGEMSLVGPRPEVPEYVKHYNDEQQRVLEVRPGITDYASIKFVNEEKLLSEAKNFEYTYIKEILPKKLKLNLEYIDNRSLLLDLKLIFLTLYHIIKY
jgi:lipopolysaccharide/colanic/teichoic acid biosynthesis glycosyltransferase